MDHVLDRMEIDYNITLEWFLEEHKTGKYKKLSENPFYEEVKAYIDSMNILRKCLGWETIKLSEEVRFRLGG